MLLNLEYMMKTVTNQPRGKIYLSIYSLCYDIGQIKNLRRTTEFDCSKRNWFIFFSLFSNFYRLRRCPLFQWHRGWREDPIQQTSRTTHSDLSSARHLMIRQDNHFGTVKIGKKRIDGRQEFIQYQYNRVSPDDRAWSGATGPSS